MKPQDHERKKSELRQRIDDIAGEISQLSDGQNRAIIALRGARAEVDGIRAGIGRMQSSDGEQARIQRERLTHAEGELERLLEEQKSFGGRLQRRRSELQQCQAELAAMEGAEDIAYRLAVYGMKRRELDEAEATATELRKKHEGLCAELDRQQAAIVEAGKAVDDAGDISSVEKAAADYESAMLRAESVATLKRNTEQRLADAATASVTIRVELEACRRGVWEAKYNALLDEARQSLKPLFRAYACSFKAHGKASFAFFLKELMPNGEAPTADEMNAIIQELLTEEPFVNLDEGIAG